MFRVALTGGIATGKSHVRGRFEALGIDTIDADTLVHEALGPGTPATVSIARRFGHGVIAVDGSVDRRRLGEQVFADDEARRDLERLLHPAVYAAITEWFEALASAGKGLGIADIPLLYETGHEGDVDAVIVAACGPEEQVRRVMARDGLSREAARQRVAAQMAIEDKIKRADFVIWTNGTLEETDRQVEELAETLKERGMTIRNEQ
jgi:dephospho-CoA kinase